MEVISYVFTPLPPYSFTICTFLELTLLKVKFFLTFKPSKPSKVYATRKTWEESGFDPDESWVLIPVYVVMWRIWRQVSAPPVRFLTDCKSWEDNWPRNNSSLKQCSAIPLRLTRYQLNLIFIFQPRVSPPYHLPSFTVFLYWWILYLYIV